MSRRPHSVRMHDTGPRQSFDKVLLGVAFTIGVVGGIALKVLGVHPFAAAGFSASVLVSYAAIAYFASALRLEPEVIGDNSYYLGFLFTLTSLSVTLYFVVESGAEDRAALIPEVISGFGVALVSTIMGVFIRVLLMQFRLDLVARERETRLEIDDTARRLRVEMVHSLQQVKMFTVESLQRSAEREAAFKQATDILIEGTRDALQHTSRMLQQEMIQAFRDQTPAAIDAIRSSIEAASSGAVAQMTISFAELGKTSERLHAGQVVARDAVDKANAALLLQTSTITDHVGQLAKRLRTISEDIETSGAVMGRSIDAATKRVEASMTETHQRLSAALQLFEQSNRDSTNRTQEMVGVLSARMNQAVVELNNASVTAARAAQDAAVANKT